MATTKQDIKLCLYKREDCMENPASLRGLHQIKGLLNCYNFPTEEIDGKTYYHVKNTAEGQSILELVNERVGGRFANWHCSVLVYCYELDMIKPHYRGKCALNSQETAQED